MEDTNDLAAKNLEAYPDVAADIINALLYEGQPVVCKEQLLSGPTETVYSGKEALRSQIEDVSKYEMIGGNINALYLFANQTTVDDGMLLRKAGYLGAAYREQYDGKITEVFPTMELVLYWGRRHWRSHTLYRLFKGRSLHPKAWKYIDELKLHVWEMRYLQEEKRKLFTSDMRIVVDFLAEGNCYVSQQKVIHKEALIRMIRVLSGDRNVEDTASLLAEMNINEEDEITVCELFDQYTRRGINRGIEALIITCKELGVSFEETAHKVGIRFQLQDGEVQENMSLYW